MKNNTPNQIISSIKKWILFFMVSLAFSGITAFPVETELNLIIQYFTFLPSSILQFLTGILNQVHTTNQNFPQLFYGYDWLVFAHVMLSILFIGVYRNPVKNIWIIEFGMLACILVFPTAFICGHVRQIPFYWQLIDCSFGIIGIIPLLIVYQKIKQLETSFSKLKS
jgi:hypothetical protein